MSSYAFLGALELGLIFALVALGVLISFRVLNFPDLTVDGSFPLGGAVAATLISLGTDPFTATLIAVLAGALAGFLTGWLNVKLHIMDLLASILMMTALYSINLRIMGKPNVPLITETTLFTYLDIHFICQELAAWFPTDSAMYHWLVNNETPDYISRPIVLGLIVLMAKLLLDRFFASEKGLAMRATGANPRMARAQGIATNRSILLGMAISNALVALAGALFAQSQGNADISMGVGTIVIGLAAVIVGENIIPARRLVWTTLAVILGAVLYRFFIALALDSDVLSFYINDVRFGLNAQDLNLVTALLVTLVLVLPRLKRKRNQHKNR